MSVSLVSEHQITGKPTSEHFLDDSGCLNRAVVGAGGSSPL